MSNINLIIEERPTNLGNFMVGRLLPFRDKRMVGPFVFIDHMGPVRMNERENFDVGPHPHIGLSTLTYLFEGNIMHRDTLGSEIEIVPGQVNWMTAGKGIVHSERTPGYLRHSDKFLHGLQIWVALPKELEQMEPAFFHVEGDAIPHWEQDGVSYKLIAGEVMGHRSPIPVYSPLYLLELKTKERKTINIGSSLFGEVGMYILEGSIENDGNKYEPKRILVAKETALCSFVMEAGTTVYLFGGTPFPEERHIYWNFVASDIALIKKAKEDWAAHRFPLINGDNDYIPLPEQSPSVHLKK
ncbi:pirin family protein [Filimonas effusa]|uniref:Pirin family protein n=1 Tax=Filimonas effusa TaxID=2508721 RepID=A0A4Q1D205_9BACT|nr:pirin family protein [Filimonas effusa]RXK81330.1 pirin family protein [Filimonas effusa]